MGRVYTFPWDLAGFVVREWQRVRVSALTRWDDRKIVTVGDQFRRTVGWSDPQIEPRPFRYGHDINSGRCYRDLEVYG
jgi:hypothetical protein